jgi:ABC-type Zn2+ transport system substrate-binding protein/surface adhesin
MKSLILILAGITITFFACKENKIDPLLMEADTIQHQAIDLGVKADNILDARLAEGAVKWNIDSLRQIKSAISNWRLEMIAIPGIDHAGHDHEGHNHDANNHEGHDHEGHDHAGHNHEQTDLAAQLTPAEIKKVQEEWLATIKTIYDGLQTK